ncbi:methylated-DNA--[protein]-cysteine S-methyltransferase [Candidatus Uabimicrobium amorphum]|uniref:DNA-3-methyladenine glycosylase II n=1 Tax=Uabimicrobium amorphum TaxID=2596890 RepID=A0A5S9ISJ4_UABAM|nr:methylated-DNA--[protein]-cysteine S-methyltransferase [Candidatus Uabimicrobium amorphum]BBM87353.1 DNA-3-methyladenine glycosylase [Candidatus Uabimicrobium amorphum]
MPHYLFDTNIGKVVLSWQDDQLKGVALATRGLHITKSKTPTWVKDIAKKIRQHLQGKYCDFDDLPLDLSSFTEFQKMVYRGCQDIGVGETLSYGELAKVIGRPRAARAVGTALKKNLFPIVIPCHRVLAAGRKLGGFSAPGSTCTKYRLLQIEKAKVANVDEEIVRWDEGVKMLGKKDKKLKNAMQKIGTFHLEKSSAHSLFESLAMSIVFQQLATAAARAIWRRFCELFPRNIPTPKQVMRCDEETLRGAGLSRNKMLAIRDLAQKTLQGDIINDDAKLTAMTDAEIIESLTQVRGIGRWTVQMLLIFYLRRLDVFPEDDYGIRKGFAILYDLAELPTPKEMRNAAQEWQPYRSIASWYLWRLTD